METANDITQSSQKFKIRQIGGRFRFPHGIAVRGEYIYVSDQNNNVIQKLDPQYEQKVIAGTGSTLKTDSIIARETTFNFNGGIVFDSKGQLYIADAWNNAIKILSPDEQTVTTFLEVVVLDAEQQPHTIRSPRSIALDKTEKFLIIANCECYNILKVDIATCTCIAMLELTRRDGLPEGFAFDKNNTFYFTSNTAVMTTDDKFKSTSEFLTCVTEPKGLLFDSVGNLWVCEESWLDKFNIVTKELMLKIQMDWPIGLAFDHSRNLVVSEYNKHMVHKIILRNPLPWKYRKWLWAGLLKHHPDTCLLASLPKELIQEICYFLWDFYE